MTYLKLLYLFEVIVYVCKADLIVRNQLSKILEDITSLGINLRNSNDVDNPYIDFLLRKSGKPLTITTYNDAKYNETRDLNLLPFGQNNGFATITNMESLQEEIECYIQPAGIFFFIITDAVNITLLEDISRTIWTYKGSAYIYFLTQTEILVYHPFMYDFQESTYGKIVKLENQVNAYKFFRDMNGFPFVIECFKSVYSVPVSNGTSKEGTDFTGADSRVAHLLQEQMNFTFVRQRPDKYLFGFKQKNGTFNGAIGRILRGETDAVLTGYFVKDYGTDDMEFTVAVYSDRLCCYVPKAKRVPQSVLPLFSLDFNMWMCYIFLAFTCGAVWCVIRSFNLWLENCRGFRIYMLRHKKQFVQILIDTWIIWVRVGLRNFPHFSSERLFVVYICILSLIFGAIFDSSLATVYIKPLYYKDINTLEDLDKSGLKIYYKYTAMKDDLFPNTTSALFTSLNEKMIYQEKTKFPLIEMMSRYGGFAGVTRDSVLSLQDVKYLTSNKIYKIPECPKTYSLAYVLPKHSAYRKRINILLLRFLEAGLINKWIDEMYFEAELTEDHAENEKVSFKILTIKDLQLPFYALILGSTLAGLVLISENYMKSGKRKKNRRFRFIH